jgi:hypothetical protein
LSENLLQVTSGVIVLSDERGGTTEESVGTSGNDNTLGFTLFASGTAKKKKSRTRALSCDAKTKEGS